MMRIDIVKDYGKLSRKAARFVAGFVEINPQASLGLPTGSTPLGMYERLIKIYNETELDFSGIRTFNLDEYIGLDRDHPRSYYSYLKEHFTGQVNLEPANTNFIDGNAADWEQECLRYESKIQEAGGIDLMILGIGRNGHIGFNEPAKSLATKTHKVDLAQETLNANSRFFESEEKMPKKALTMGVGTILKARNILLLANGNSKALAVDKFINGEISTEFPASLLHTHLAVRVIIDHEAAEKI